MKHIGYTGRTGNKAHRARRRKEKKILTPSKPPVQGKRG